MALTGLLKPEEMTELRRCIENGAAAGRREEGTHESATAYTYAVDAHCDAETHPVACPHHMVDATEGNSPEGGSSASAGAA